MNSYYREIGFGAVLITLFGGLIFWFVKHEPQALLKIGIAGIIILVGIISFIRKVITTRRDTVSGAPPEDEFTKLAKVYAGNRAFHSSLYLWYLIFIFHTSFSKPMEMLGVGILGSALIYGISLWYYNTSGGFNEESNERA
jgi:uncharacterized membrane protein